MARLLCLANRKQQLIDRITRPSRRGLPLGSTDVRKAVNGTTVANNVRRKSSSKNVYNWF
jgi:hypothetical protein